MYLALSSPWGPGVAPEVQRLSRPGGKTPGTPYGLPTITSKGSHARNILRHPVATGQFAASFGAGRFLARGRRVPGFFMYSKDHLYPFQYHGEQRPNRASRVTLTGEKHPLAPRQ